jgi:hypothetical protein
VWSGESWYWNNNYCTTLYLLQQLAMIQKQPVVYTIRKSLGSKDIFYEFVPVAENEKVKDITVKVYELYTGDKRSKIPSMRRKGAFYVVDPGTYTGSCDDTDDLYKARLIIALPQTMTGTGVQTIF